MLACPVLAAPTLQAADADDQENELQALESIYPDTFRRASTPAAFHEVCIEVDMPAGRSVVLQTTVGPSAAAATAAAAGAGASSPTPSTPVARFSLARFPSVTLRFRYPATYPSAAPPDFVLDSVLGDSEDLQERLREALLRVFHESDGFVCVFAWMEWLKSELLQCIGTADEDGALVIAVPNDAYRRLVADDLDGSQASFNDSLQTCDACFDEKRGAEFVRMDGCPHFFCRSCVLAYLVQETTNGRVVDVGCLDIGCSGTIQPHTLTAVLREGKRDDLVELYDRLSFQKGLEAMGDIVYCPRKTCGQVRPRLHAARCYCLLFCTPAL